MGQGRRSALGSAGEDWIQCRVQRGTVQALVGEKRFLSHPTNRVLSLRCRCRCKVLVLSWVAALLQLDLFMTTHRLFPSSSLRFLLRLRLYSPSTPSTLSRHAQLSSLRPPFRPSANPVREYSSPSIRNDTPTPRSSKRDKSGQQSSSLHTTATGGMAQTNAIQQLVDKAGGLTLDSIAQAYPNAHPEANPLDAYRAHISNVLSDISGVSREIIYPVVSWTAALEKGDFVIAVPALRIKGPKPDVLAAEWAAKVRDLSSKLEMRMVNMGNEFG